MTIRSQLLISFFSLIVVFVGAFWINQRLSEAVLKNTTYLNNSETIIRNSNMLHKEMIEMQSGFRGFLLTNQESFLDSYYEGLKSVPSLINEQRDLLSANQQKVKLDSINLIHKDWVEYADSLILTKKDTMPEGGIQYKRLFESKLKMEFGKRLNDKIHSMFVSFDDYEYRLRKERRSVLQQSITRTKNISLSLIIIAIFLALILGFYITRMITNRISKMVKLSERISTGDFITSTDTKKDEFARLIDSLNQMSQTLDKSFQELKKKNKELDQFAYVVSHDLKAPLRGITNLISWIEEDHSMDITPEINKNLTLIKGRTDRLENMINGLLNYARVGKMKKGVERVDVNIILQEIKELIVPPHVIVTISDSMPVIQTEKLLLEQVFSNLISNAVKHNQSKNPEVIITYKDTGDSDEFSVSDNGLGIEKEYFDKIFIIFQTLQERDAFESTGVGLAIVKKVIEDVNGAIIVKSELGKGTTFTFSWPKEKTIKK